eukprot:TRINITY_DN19537_c0_g1_i2.p1 TRINITY_DN19537_c0_g1~~TRINITY_DN19537_c0_g1_i2.p1  ORF type:complete len:105 (-),score=18.34 TRINITY_DN19537_c0_g1_i2:256-570(-)
MTQHDGDTWVCGDGKRDETDSLNVAVGEEPRPGKRRPSRILSMLGLVSDHQQEKSKLSSAIVDFVPDFVQTSNKEIESPDDLQFARQTSTESKASRTSFRQGRP